MRKLATIVLGGLLIVQIIYVTYGVVINPFPTGDAYGIWFLKAKAITQAVGVEEYIGFLKDNEYQYSHPEYPLLWPFFLSLFGDNLNVWMLVYPVIFTILIAVVYATVMAKSNHIWALMAAFSISSVMIIERAAGRNEVGFADLPLSLFYLSTAWLYHKEKVNWLWIGVFLGVAANIKIEGLLGSVLCALVLCPRDGKFWLSFIPLAVAWPVCSYLLNLQTIYGNTLSLDYLIHNMVKVPIVIDLVKKEFFNLGRYGLWLPIFVISLFQKYERKTWKINLWLVMYLICLVGSYFFTPLPLVRHWDSSFYRIIVGVLPIIILNSFIMNLCLLEKKF